MKKNIIEISIKTEPAGEYRLSKIDQEGIDQFLEAYKDKESFPNSEILQLLIYDEYTKQIGTSYGVLTGCNSDSDGLPDGVKYRKIDSVTFPRDDNGNITDGYYVIFSCPTKMSLQIITETPDGEPFDPCALEILYAEVDLSPYEDESGELEMCIISDVMYKGNLLVDDIFEHLVDRGCYRNLTILKVEQGDETEIFRMRGKDIEYLN